MKEPIDRAYQAVFGRMCDPAGLATYGQALNDGRLSLEELIGKLIESEEFASTNHLGPEERALVNALVKLHTDFVVQAGPFAGMKFLDLSNRGDGDVSPKLLGTYEQEIHPAISSFSANCYDAIVDVGCAEGYFAVGLARLFPKTPVLAYDTDEIALDILMRLAELNECSNQITIGSFCDPIELGKIFTQKPRTLTIVDCEGYEKELFRNSEINKLSASSDLIIECHDLWDAEITPSLINALTDTHHIEIIHATGRNPNVYDFLAHLSDWDRFRAIWERRGARQNWLICRSKAYL